MDLFVKRVHDPGERCIHIQLGEAEQECYHRINCSYGQKQIRSQTLTLSEFLGIWAILLPAFQFQQAVTAAGGKGKSFGYHCLLVCVQAQSLSLFSLGLRAKPASFSAGMTK